MNIEVTLFLEVLYGTRKGIFAEVQIKQQPSKRNGKPEDEQEEVEKSRTSWQTQRRRKWKTEGLEGGVDTLRCEDRGARVAKHYLISTSSKHKDRNTQVV